ncbi:helix-turn-helix domain-containing protein [Fictibacillus sp. Mic-4]|uniref:winged helix-turn-helix domain-containing protein n=1 Tax=Fictibacillus TaxID=1329200 RepID=UPI00040680FA|nr:helix-turn-helix domain-containing protein [Fictibacillus gelatini]
MEKRDEILETYVVTIPEQAAALLHPVRSEIIRALKEPRSATEVAKLLDETPQKINYHLKTLEKVGLVRRVGTRNVRNLVEVLYQAVAQNLILSDSLGMSAETAQKLKDQSALAHVLSLTEKMKKDAIRLMEQSEEEEIPSAALQTSITLRTKEERNQFVNEYVALVGQLIEKYQSDVDEKSVSYHVSLAVYPKPEGSEKNGS